MLDRKEILRVLFGFRMYTRYVCIVAALFVAIARPTGAFFYEIINNYL